MTRIQLPRLLAPAVAALALTACGDAGSRSTVVTKYWEQPDTVIIGLGHPSDVKARSRDEVFVADRESGLIFDLKPGEETYRSIGLADREPKEVELPGKLAVSPDIGVASYDIKTKRVDLFTFSGEFVRGFEPGFVPAVMAFSKVPLGYTFGVAPVDSAATAAARAAAPDSVPGDSVPAVRRALVIHTNLQGEKPDTLLSATHGPEALRGTLAGAGETSMTPSTSGMWVWSKLVRDTVFEIGPRTARKVFLSRPETPIGLLADEPLGMLWTVLPDSAGVRLQAYDARAQGYLGERKIDDRTYVPWAIHDGVLMGFRRIPGGAVAMTAYDLHTEEFARSEE